jgi:NAD(P)-dependent dehydrogenase (short-subunit alcohol dehydrogenase family)
MVGLPMSTIARTRKRLTPSSRRSPKAAAAFALKGNIAVEADVLGIFDAATNAGPLSAVIAKAGIVAPRGKLAEMSVERMWRVFEVNGARRLPQS